MYLSEDKIIFISVTDIKVEAIVTNTEILKFLDKKFIGEIEYAIIL